MVDLRLLEYLEDFITPERKERFVAVLEKRTKYITVAVEDVFQLHNTSAVIRSCEVFGVQEAHIIDNSLGRGLDKNIAMGAEQWVDIKRYENTEKCLNHLRHSGYRIIATTPHNDSCLLNEFNLESKTALFFGTEKEGLSQTVLHNADGFLKIPMVGLTESLNISVSAAIILQHLRTLLDDSEIQWHLSESEKLEKLLDWSKKSIKSIGDILDRYHQGK
jgi:tRNA (guanosine-2'-O-)-methyltransferase